MPFGEESFEKQHKLKQTGVCTGTCAPFVMCGFISHMHEIVEMLLETTLHL